MIFDDKWRSWGEYVRAVRRYGKVRERPGSMDSVLQWASDHRAVALWFDMKTMSVCAMVPAIIQGTVTISCGFDRVVER